MLHHARRARPAVLVAILLLFAAACIPRLPGELTDQQLAQLRGCEVRGSSHPYSQTSRSGRYRGAYQFDRATWDSVASRHFPSAVGLDPADAPAWLQDHLARKLAGERHGLSAWPICGSSVT